MTYYNADKPFADLFCGSGTLPIEVAMRSLHIAPGMHRSFDFTAWKCAPRQVLENALTEAKDAVYDRVLIKEYPSGGKEYKTIIVSPAIEANEAWDEYEDIQVYIPYTEAELQEQYENAVNAAIREKYTLSQELAILRQRETKPEEYAEYNAYCEACKAQSKAKYNIGE